MRTSLCCLVLLVLLMIPRAAHAQGCLAELTGAYARRFTSVPQNQESAGFRFGCLFITGLYFERVDRHPGFTIDETVPLPLNEIWQHGSVSGPIVFVDPGVGRHFGDGLRWFGTIGGGVAWPIKKDGNVYFTLEVRQRYRFGSPANAGTQITVGIMTEADD